MSGASGSGASGGAQPSPSATVGSVHQRQPLGTIQPKAGPKSVKKTPKRKR